MPIQFACPYCDKVSSVPNSFGGKKGRCPNCSKVIEVPDPNAPDGGGGDAGAEAGGEAPRDDARAPREEGAGRPSDSSGGMVDCKFCGESIKKVAKKCRYCGEFFDRGMRDQRNVRRVRPFGRFSAGDAMSRGWETMMANVGPSLAACLVFLVCLGAFQFVLSFISQIVVVAADNHPVAVVLNQLVMQVVSSVVSTFFTLGLVKIALDMLRGKPFQIGDMFAQGKFLVQGVIAQILITILTVILIVPGIAIGAGVAAAAKEPELGILVGVLCVIPPVTYLSIKMIFVQWLIVDTGTDGINAMRQSFSMTTGHGWGIFLLGILITGVTIAGMLALCVGLLFTYPAVWLAIGTAYLCLKPKGGPDGRPSPVYDRI